MTLPNFLILGAAKSGTTSLHHYLNQHPEIYMSPIKETNFFVYQDMKLEFQGWGDPPLAALKSITNIKDYRAQFADVGEEKAIGETSPLYLYDERAAPRIYQAIPEAKLIAILRDPAERAFSHYISNFSDDRDPCLTFGEALQAEEWRMQKNWFWDYFYRDCGYYFRQLKRYWALFPKDRILVLLYDDFKNNPLKILQGIFDFLNVNSSFIPDTSFQSNVSGIAKLESIKPILRQPNHPLKSLVRPFTSQKFRRFVVTQMRKNLLEKPEILVEDRQKLAAAYREDIKQLQKMVEKDLSSWLR